MKTPFREFQIFAKPVGSKCNLNCSYCYYLAKKNLYPGKPIFLMDDDLLERYIFQHIEATTDETVIFSWHGGEPLLAGIDFYRKAVTLQRKHLPEGRKCLNGIQTNGTLLDDELCQFLAEERFVVGMSIDGTEILHNRHRKNKHGKGSFVQTMQGLACLMKHGITPEVLCVVNAQNVEYPSEIYGFFKQLGIKYLTFIPLVERNEDSPSGVSVDSVPAEEFGRFLAIIFDEWVENDIGKTQIQIFEEAIRTAFNREHTLCIFKKNCGGVPVVEFNGDFYSCDHYVNKDHLLGNITENSVSYYLDSTAQQAFGRAKSETLPRFCLECTVKEMCNGECPKNRFIKTPAGEPGLNYLCPGYKLFFEHCRPFIEAVRLMSV